MNQFLEKEVIKEIWSLLGQIKTKEIKMGIQILQVIKDKLIMLVFIEKQQHWSK